MTQTVIGIFNDASEAQMAMQELTEAGFSRNSIDLSTQQTPDTADTSYDYRHDEDTPHNKKGGIVGFFASLFDSDDDRDRYTSVGYRNSIVTVHVENEDQAERAADILDEAGAIDVDERADQYQANSYQRNAVADSSAPDSTRVDTGESRNYAASSAISTGVSADPLAPIYGDTPHVTTEINDNNPTMSDNDTRTPSTADHETSMPTMDRGQMRSRSRIINRSVDDQFRLREQRMRSGGSALDFDLKPDPNRPADQPHPVDPESDVTNR